MARLLKFLTVIISLATGLLTSREIYGLLPSWEGESWPWVALDAGSLLLAFFLISGLVYYVISDMSRWLLDKSRRPPRP
ncbi:MAG: hypothetical protein K9K65_06370 [Desulfarculaceae bacterium]|nr:hypothetical protein [Desulfarculaceae bacterium]MCF8046815.1 hypothetical protein [Desulfarculaceae bacterium]MCF8065092.1 hypothetical protein [Desulfarculaceae bacterium]MCF8097451.1 hypothetical protein [Desulfarculaceae bacterium]MCF8121404.1 hypothetical protein [Desulfarculaceae bacterium]